MIWRRSGGGRLGRGEKLLLVIDQFEQWLHGKSDKDRRRAVLAACGSVMACAVPADWSATTSGWPSAAS